jgi:hypothetical protein
VWLLLEHPQLAARDCQHCLAYLYDETTGRVMLNADGTPKKRPRGVLAPCRFKEKLVAQNYPPDSPTMKKAGCPKGTPEDSRELSPENRLAYEHYVQCKAVGRFPDDEIVERNAGIIRSVEDAHARKVQQNNGEVFLQTAQAIIQSMALPRM